MCIMKREYEKIEKDINIDSNEQLKHHVNI